MELIDSPTFPRIDRVLHMKRKLLEEVKTSREESSFQENAESSNVSTSSMKELVRKSLEAPALAPSVFDGVATRARALQYHGKEQEFIDRLAVPPRMSQSRSQRAASPMEEIVIKGPDHYRDLALSVFTNEKQSQLSKKQRLVLARRLGKSRLAELHRDHFLKRAGFAALSMSIADDLVDSSGSQDAREASLVGVLRAAAEGEINIEQEGLEEESQWETLYDETHDSYYYYNAATGESEWRTEPVWQRDNNTMR